MVEKELFCFGKRFKAYDKCEKCNTIISCSRITLEEQFPNVKVVGP